MAELSRSTVVAWVAVLAGLALAADWPHVRGPGYDATSPETGLAEHWPAAGPPVLWSRELGPGYSGIAVADGRAFTLFQTKTGMFLSALDADSGAELWQVRVDWPWQPGGMYPGPYASPTWHAGRVFYATPFGRVGCVDAADGRAIWSVNVRESFGSRGTEFGFAATPLVEAGRVILPVGGERAALVALNVTDGSTLWAVGDDPASYCPAYPITLDGRRLIVGFLRNALVLHDPVTGERVWREPLSSDYDEHAAWPLFDGRNLLIASPFRAGARVYRLAESGGKAVWSGQQLSNDVCSSLLLDGSIYGFDLHQAQASTHRPSRGAFKCLDMATGRVRWETTAVGQASPIAADGKLILWAETGTLLLARANPERYEELARAAILTGGGMCWAAPALSGKRLYVRDHQRAVCVYLGPPADLDPARPTVSLAARGAGFAWSRLLPHEPEFPNDAPTVADVGRWFAWCIGILVVAALVAGLSRWLWPGLGALRAFGVCAFVFGAAGTTVLGAWADTFALTWPVSLYVAFLSVAWLGLKRPTGGWRHQVAARLGLALFAALCYGYYLLCLAVGYAMAWGFLAGFVVAAPFAVTTVRAERGWVRGVTASVGFAAYFWISGLIPGWKALWRG